MAFQGSLSQCFCWLPCIGGGGTSIQYSSGSQSYLWQKSARHLFGEFSMATEQANLHNEDRCHLVSGNLTDKADGPRGVFVGVYDGHGGTTCSQFILENLFNNLKTAIANQLGNVAIRDEVRDDIQAAVRDAIEDAIRDAYEVTENTFVQLVRDEWYHDIELAMTGSCCLVGLVHDNILYVANAGDSRAVLARRGLEGGPFEAVQLSIDYDANDSNRRIEVLEEHPGRNENDLFTNVNESWRLGGNLQVTRAIGHAYLKYNEFNYHSLPERFRQQEDIVEPILKAKPTVQRHHLSQNDRFVIFASDGLWDEMGNTEAVEIVKSIADRDRTLAAATLIEKALERAAAKREIEYEYFKGICPYGRRFFHDDISVVILYFDHLPYSQSQPEHNVGAAVEEHNSEDSESNSGASTNVSGDSVPSDSESSVSSDSYFDAEEQL